MPMVTLGSDGDRNSEVQWSLPKDDKHRLA